MAETEQKTFEETVTDLARDAKYDTEGMLALPEGTTEEAEYAVTLSLLNKETNDSHMADQQAIASFKAQNDVLTKKVQSLLAKGAYSTLNTSDKERLDELRTDDPESWRAEMDALEARVSTATDEDLKKQLSDADSGAIIAARSKLLDAHNAANPGRQITQDVIDNDVPPRIKNKLVRGTIDFAEFLAEVSEYTARGKKVVQNPVPKTKKFNTVGGTSDSAKSASVAGTSYEDEIY